MDRLSQIALLFLLENTLFPQPGYSIKSENGIDHVIVPIKNAIWY